MLSVDSTESTGQTQGPKNALLRVSHPARRGVLHPGRLKARKRNRRLCKHGHAQCLALRRLPLGLHHASELVVIHLHVTPSSIPLPTPSSDDVALLARSARSSLGSLLYRETCHRHGTLLEGVDFDALKATRSCKRVSKFCYMGINYGLTSLNSRVSCSGPGQPLQGCKMLKLPRLTLPELVACVIALVLPAVGNALLGEPGSPPAPQIDASGAATMAAGTAVVVVGLAITTAFRQAHQMLRVFIYAGAVLAVGGFALRTGAGVFG